MPARRDFVEQGTALEALKVSETLYRSIVEMLPNAIVIIQPDGSITAANSQTLDLFGLKSLSDFLGRNVFDFILPEERDRSNRTWGAWQCRRNCTTRNTGCCARTEPPSGPK